MISFWIAYIYFVPINILIRHSAWVQSEAARDDVATIPIAFDMEWPFSFQTGPGRSAVIQMCADVNRCYVLHISRLTVLPPSLLQVLYHEKVCLHGVCVKK